MAQKAKKTANPQKKSSVSTRIEKNTLTRAERDEIYSNNLIRSFIPEGVKYEKIQIGLEGRTAI